MKHSLTMMMSLASVLALSSLALAAPVLYVSPTGKDSNNGSKAKPMSLQAAVAAMSAQLKEDPDKAAKKMVLKGGTYYIQSPIVLGPEFKGSEKAPIIITAQEGEKVLFDGSMPIDPKSFSKVRDPKEKAALAASVADKIYVTTIADPLMIKTFSARLMRNLLIDGKSYRPSVYPNEGYAYLKEETVTGEVTPPAMPLGERGRAGHHPYCEEGKARGWRGSLEEPRGARVGIRNDENMAGTWQQWEDELARNNKRNSLVGYIEADWLFSSQAIYAASAKDSCVHLTLALAYGWDWRKNDKPFRVFGMLCELDQAGEWHFDPLTNKLYIYPLDKWSAKTKVSLPVATGVMQLNGCEYVELRGLSACHLAEGAAYTLKGAHNTIAGASIYASTAAGVNIEGEHNTLLSCDLYDLAPHVRLSGGKRSLNSIEPGNNVVQNCHIYQKNDTHQKVSIAVYGVGNTFSHNLVHHSIGQAMTVNGNDHMVEYNEFFNIGYEEGDGGAIYSGADLSGYGNTYRYNFFHHLMHHPGKVERAGIHLDDGQAGGICYGNIFFKSASKCLFSFGGAGNQMYDNIFLNSSRGAYLVGSLCDRMLAVEAEIKADPNSPKVGLKEDYVGRVEKTIGKECWNESPWKDRYPLFPIVMNDTGRFGRLWPICNKVVNNYSYGNKINKIADSRIEAEALAKNEIEEYKEISPEDFVDYDKLDLRLRSKSKFPHVPFAEMGLVKDKYRTELPDKAKYRRAIREFFRGVKSVPGTKEHMDTSRLFE